MEFSASCRRAPCYAELLSIDPRERRLKISSGSDGTRIKIVTRRLGATNARHTAHGIDKIGRSGGRPDGNESIRVDPR